MIETMRSICNAILKRRHNSAMMASTGISAGSIFFPCCCCYIFISFLVYNVSILIILFALLSITPEAAKGNKKWRWGRSRNSWPKVWGQTPHVERVLEKVGSTDWSPGHCGLCITPLLQFHQVLTAFVPNLPTNLLLFNEQAGLCRRNVGVIGWRPFDSQRV